MDNIITKEIIDIAQEKLEELKEKYSGFITVILDNWRGVHFIYDTEDVRKCNNDCQNCPLYNLLKDEKKVGEGEFSAELFYPTKTNDKKLFGLAKCMNCKSLPQYKNCFVNYFVYEATGDNIESTEKNIKDELEYIKNLKIIFSKDNDPQELENVFKQDTINEALALVDKEKRKLIEKFI
jgi:hypothetical protein